MAQPFGKAAELISRLNHLRVRMGALDQRWQSMSLVRQPARPDEVAEMQALQERLSEARVNLERVRWSAQVAQYFLKKLQESRFPYFAVPKSILTIQPDIMICVRDTIARLEPKSDSRDVMTVSQEAPVLKIADLQGLDWALVWLHDTGDFGYLPTSALKAYQ